MNKNVIAVSLFNYNNFLLQDIPHDILKESILVYFVIDNEYYKNKHKIEKYVNLTKKSLRIPIEDIDLTLEELLKNDKLITGEEKLASYEKMLGGKFECPNLKQIRKIKNFISDHPQVIVACSAGKSRTGAVVTYLINQGYNLDCNYNTRFTPNVLMLDMLTYDHKYIRKEG